MSPQRLPRLTRGVLHGRGPGAQWPDTVRLVGVPRSGLWPLWLLAAGGCCRLRLDRTASPGRVDTPKIDRRARAGMVPLVPCRRHAAPSAYRSSCQSGVGKASRESPARSHADFPTNHSEAAVLLGCAGLRADATLRHGGRRRHVAYRHLSARHRPGALEGGLCAAQPAPQGRPVWRKPESAAALLPVPGGDEAGARQYPGSVSGLAEGAGPGSAAQRHPLCRGRLGESRRWAPGVWAGRSGSTAWR